MPKMTTAYHGSADITADNAASILNNLLPEDPPEGEGIGLVIVPSSVPRFRKGLKTVIGWLEGEVGKDGTIPADDVLAELLTRAEYTDDDGNAQSDDLVLVMLYDPENDDDVLLAQRAHEDGVRVVNLAAAGDDLLFEEPEPEPEPEVPAAEEAPPWQAPAEDVAAAVARATEAGMATAAAQEAAGAVGPEARPVPGQGVSVTLSLSQDAIDLLAAAIVEALRQGGELADVRVVERELASVTDISPVEKGVIGSTTEQAEGTTPYYYHEGNCKYRPARGRPKAGETKVYLTDEGIRQVTLLKLLA